MKVYLQSQSLILSYLFFFFSEKAVFQHLEEFLKETDTILQKQNKNHELELCLMLIQCIEVKKYEFILP